MRMILLAGAVLALSACGGVNNDAANNAAADNLSMDANLGMDANMSMDANAATGDALNGVNAAEANGSVDAATANAMKTDARTHDADTNLANGM